MKWILSLQGKTWRAPRKARKRQQQKATQSVFFHVFTALPPHAFKIIASAAVAVVVAAAAAVMPCYSKPVTSWQSAVGHASCVTAHGRKLLKERRASQRCRATFHLPQTCTENLSVFDSPQTEQNNTKINTHTHEWDQTQGSFSFQLVISFIRLQPLEMWPVIDPLFMRLFQLKTQLQVHFHYDGIHSSLLG